MYTAVLVTQDRCAGPDRGRRGGGGGHEGGRGSGGVGAVNVFDEPRAGARARRLKFNLNLDFHLSKFMILFFKNKSVSHRLGYE